MRFRCRLDVQDGKHAPSMSEFIGKFDADGSISRFRFAYVAKPIFVRAGAKLPRSNILSALLSWLAIQPYRGWH